MSQVNVSCSTPAYSTKTSLQRTIMEKRMFPSRDEAAQHLRDNGMRFQGALGRWHKLDVQGTVYADIRKVIQGYRVVIKAEHPPK